MAKLSTVVWCIAVLMAVNLWSRNVHAGVPPLMSSWSSWSSSSSSSSSESRERVYKFKGKDNKDDSIIPPSFIFLIVLYKLSFAFM